MGRLSQTSLVLDAQVDRGADNLATRCLRVRASERVHVLAFRGDDLASTVARAIERAGGVVVRVSLEPLADLAAPQLDARLAEALAGASATVMLAPEGVPVAVSLAVLRAAQHAGSRHVHMPRVDGRVLATAARAEPDLIALINGRLAALLQPPSRVKVTSETGTAFEAQLAPQYPLVRAEGRPGPAQRDNVPSGFVYTYPAQIDGVFVADRGAWGGGLDAPSATLRRHPLRITLVHGRVSRVECDDAELRALAEGYLASHPHAARVGMLTFPTNYLARTEIGNDVHDSLMPGANLCLGFSESASTRAPFDAPVQLRVMGRKQTVEIQGQRAVSAGRFEDAFVEGIDPFR